MDSTQYVKNQIIVRAMQDPHMATDVVGSHSEAIFGDSQEFNTLAEVIARYYYAHKDPLTKDVMDTLMSKQVNFLEKNQKITDQKTAIKYLHDSNELMAAKLDTSAAMTTKVSNFIHNRLAKTAVVMAFAKSKRDSNYNLPVNLQKILDKVNSIDVSGQGDQVIDVLNPKDMDKEHQAFMNLNVDKIPMGISNIDEATNNGIEKGSTNLINASSGSGKSTVLSNFSISYLTHGYNVFHISLEELASDMLIRFVRILLGMSTNELFDKDGKLNQDAEAKVYEKFGLLSQNSRLGKLFFYRTSPRTMTVDGLRQLIVSTERLHHIKFDVIVLDYPALLINPYSYHGTNESSAGEKLFQDLKKLALDTDTVMWVASQLNRMSTNADVKSANFLEGSYRKINSVNTSFTLNRTAKEFQNNCFKLHVDKLRNRDDFSDEFLYFKYDNMRIIPENSNEIKKHQELDNPQKQNNNSNVGGSFL